MSAENSAATIIEIPKSATPKYQLIADHIRSRIQTGEWQRGERIASVSELCTQFATSPTVVDRALFVLDQEGIIERQHGRGIFVAQWDRPRLKHLIGLQWPQGDLPDRFGHYGGDIIRGIERAAHRLGFELLLLNSTRTDYREILDGVIFAGVNDDQLRAAQVSRIPAVSVIIASRDLASVVADDFGGARLAVTHLTELGHRRIASLTWTPTTDLQMSRHNGYLAGLSDAGIEADQRWSRRLTMDTGVYPPSQSACTQRNLERWLNEDWEELGCTALICQNDDHAVGALRAFQASGRNVPGDVSVIGFDGTSFGESTSPRLTSVAVPLERIGDTAAEIVIKAAQGCESEATSIVLKTSLRIRESSGPAPVRSSLQP